VAWPAFFLILPLISVTLLAALFSAPIMGSLRWHWRLTQLSAEASPKPDLAGTPGSAWLEVTAVTTTIEPMTAQIDQRPAQQ
jgi:hypothetical protein